MSRQNQSIKLPSPVEPVVSTYDQTLISKPWYQYFITADNMWRGAVEVLTTESTVGVIRNHHMTIFDSTPGVVHELEDPRPDTRVVIVCSMASTQAGSVTVAAATNVAIGPGGENALNFPTSVSTYDLVELIGANSTQYYIVNQTTNVSVVASS